MVQTDRHLVKKVQMPCKSTTMDIKASLHTMYKHNSFEYSHSLKIHQLDTYLIVLSSFSAGWGCAGGIVDVGERITV